MTDHALEIILVDDDQIIHQTLGDFLSNLGHRVHNEYRANAALDAVKNREYDVALLDIRLPDTDGLKLMTRIHEICPDLLIILITGHGTMETVIEALRQGATDFLAKPVRLLELEATLERCIQIRHLKKEANHLHSAIKIIQSPDSLRSGAHKLVGTSQAIQTVREQIKQVVEANCDTVLITGETGTGKEIVARQIHHYAGADKYPFFAVSCPTLTESLFESELFGHQKGSYTGAHKDSPGYFELADNGTLFLDEIGDLTQPAQAKLLRVLETRTIRRIGASKEIKVNLRLIAATNNVLEESVNNNTFRQDLYYRLNVYNIHLSPLRDNKEDITPLAHHFLQTYAVSKKRNFEGLSPGALNLLLQYDYPGNVRELRNIIERAAILCQSEQIQAEHIVISQKIKAPPEKKLDNSNTESEQSRIVKALEETKWNRQKAAKELGMPYSTLRYKINKFGIR